MIIIQNQAIHQPQLEFSWATNKVMKQIINALDNNQSTFQYKDIEDLKFEVTYRQHIIHAAIELSQSQVSFATFYYSRCNPSFWAITNEGGFSLQQNVKPSDAIMDIYKKSRQYAFECATAMMIILYRAYLDTEGAEAFNQRFHSLYLYDWHHHANFPIQTIDVDKGIPGDIRYFKNPDVNPRTPQWQGENTIQLTENSYYGHGVGIKDAQGVVNELNTHTKPGATHLPYLMKQATRPVFQKLESRSLQHVIDRMSIKVGN